MKENEFSNLYCPYTGHSTKLDNPTIVDGEVVAGALISGNNSYPIIDSIPSFVPQSVSDTQTVRSFNDKWKTHNYYRKHTESFYTDWFLDRYSFKTTTALSDCLSSCSYVLDAGTGLGRDAANFVAFSSASVFAVDTSLLALSTAKHDISHPRFLPIHADVDNLPFKSEFFDFINCDQVIHHLPDPKSAFIRLGKLLKPGGQICCYVYKKKSVPREFIDDYVREKISHLPLKDAEEICKGFTQLGKELSDLDITINIDNDIDVLGIKRGNYPLQRFFHYNIMKCFWNDEFDFFTNNIVNVDWYHPKHCHRFEPAEFHSWFESGWNIQSWDVRNAGISCRAIKE